MIISNLARPRNQQPMTLPELVEAINPPTAAGQSVSIERSKNIATAYRCINILSDDIAKMPLQLFESRMSGQVKRVAPSNMGPNMAWLLEVQPNRFMTPFIFKKLLGTWLITRGNAYAWQPPMRPGRRHELLVLPSDRVRPVYDMAGNVWYEVTWETGDPQYLPDVEVLNLVINSEDGITGKGVIAYARETLGRQLGAHETQSKFYGQGLNPGGIMWISGEANKEARKKIRDAYGEAMSGSENAYRLAVLDNKVTKFETITMKPVDAQFLESILQNDLEIANYFGMPLFKLNQGKQAYNSNEQANLDYLSTTLDPYLVQFEQGTRLRWLTEAEQGYSYLRFNRDVLLRTDAKTRAEYLEKKILSGQLSPNEARQIEDLSAYPGGDDRYIPANMMKIGGDNNA